MKAILHLLAKANRQPWRRRILFLRVSALMLFLRVALRLFPFASVYQWMKRFHRARAGRDPGPGAAEDICWAVTRAGYLWFGDAGCLVQGLLGETMLARLGLPARMRIGVRRGPKHTLLAHAWVEVDGQVWIGGDARSVAENFQILPEIQGIITHEESR